MALIQHMVSAGSPEKSAGRAALSSTLVAMEVTGAGARGVGGAVAGVEFAGGAALCLGGLGCRGAGAGGACDTGVEGCSSSSLVSLLLSPKVRVSARVTVHILSHRVYLFSFLRRTHLLWGLYSYDWYHCMYLVGPTSFSLFLL
jgi:hypothetical protein